MQVTEHTKRNNVCAAHDKNKRLKMTLIYCKTALGLCQSSLTLDDVVRMQNDPIQTSPEDEERDSLSSVDFHLLLADSSALIFFSAQ